MIDYLACIIKDGMTDAEIYEAIVTTPAYYVVDARTLPDRPIKLIYDEQKDRKVFGGITKEVPAGRGRPNPIKI